MGLFEIFTQSLSTRFSPLPFLYTQSDTIALKNRARRPPETEVRNARPGLEDAMQDFWFLAATVIFFAVSIGYAHACEKL